MENAMIQNPGLDHPLITHTLSTKYRRMEYPVIILGSAPTSLGWTFGNSTPLIAPTPVVLNLSLMEMALPRDAVAFFLSAANSKNDSHSAADFGPILGTLNGITT